MTDRKDAENLSALEAEVEAARARLNDSLQNLTRPSISEAVKHDIRAYADTMKDELVEKISTTREQLVSSAREATRQRVHRLSDSLRERAAANPLALVMIGAGLGWRLYRRPPVATLLMGAGAASLLMNARRRSARHFDEFHNPYRSDHPATYVPGGVAGYGYPVEEQAPPATMRERAEQLGDSIQQATSDLRDKAGDLAARVTDKAGDIAQRVTDAADAGRARVAQAANEMGREVRHYGAAAQRDLSNDGGRYGVLLGAIGLSLAAIAVGAARVAAARRSEPEAAGRKAAAEARSSDGSFATSEDAFIAKLRDSDPGDQSFIRDSAIATEDIVGDTEPATRGGEHRQGGEQESVKARRKRAGSEP
jgi:hypothetical protein